MEKNKDTSKTKQYQLKGNKKTKRYNNEHELDTKQNSKRKKKKHKVLKRVILTLFLLVMLAGLGGVGIIAGIFFSDKWAITAEDLIAKGNSEVYDSEGKLSAVLSTEDANRKIISLDEMGKYTANAYIAIEDKRFEEHSGIDILRTANATISYILHRGEDSSVGGGSTITQQLVKNLMKDDDDSGMAGVERKIREMSRAYQVETMLTKSQILEKYLNQIFVGGNELYGVEYGAKYYFAKSAKDLDLAESAFLAGINNAPNMYNPYDKDNDHSELIKNRTKLVLNFMKEQNRISENAEEAEKLYNEAVAKVDAGLKFKKGKIEIGGYSYFVEEAIQEAAQDLADAKDIDYKAARSMIISGGYKLYTTQDTKIQDRVIEEMSKDTYVSSKTITEKDKDGKSKKVTITTNAGMTIIDHTNGKVVALGGDLKNDLGQMGTNYATSTRQTGSSIKPLANVAPGLEEKVITAATVYDDTRTDFGKYAPGNVGSYYGLCTVRKAIERSSNVVNLKIISNVGVNKAIDYLHEFGLTTYVKGEDGLSLGIGGAVHGSSTLQMAAAYATLANKGVYIEPTFYIKLEDSNGNVVVEPKQETRRVISEANAYIISDILIDVVTGAEGTAGRCAISGMDVAAKTGTTDDYVDKWLCGYTPYYSAAVWYGFGYNSQTSIAAGDRNNAIYIWANVMKDVHKDLAKKRFTKPSNIVTATICRQSGKVATNECKNTYTEYFVSGTVPAACDGHVTLKICKESGKVATEYCTDVEEKTYATKPEKERNANWKPTNSKAEEKYKVPEEQCNIHTAEANQITIVNVVGSSEEMARSLLAGLDIRVIYETHSDMENGVVIRQSLEEGTVVNKGVTIIITVNKLETTEEPPAGGEENPQEPENPNDNTQTNTESNSIVDTNTEIGTN